MFCFRILRIFGEIVKRGKLENLEKIGLLRRSVGNPHRGVDLRQGVGSLATARPTCQNGNPRVRQGVVKLRHGIATVHSEKFLDFCFQTPRIRTSIV